MTTMEISPVARALFHQMRKDHLLEYCVYHLPPTGSVLEVERCSNNAMFTSRQHLQDFVTSLPPEECRYVIYNFRFLTADGGNMYKLIFILWCPHEADGAERELYAGARSAVRRQLAGISFEVFAQAQEDLDYDIIMRLLGV